MQIAEAAVLLIAEILRDYETTAGHTQALYKKKKQEIKKILTLRHRICYYNKAVTYSRDKYKKLSEKKLKKCLT